MVGFIRTRSKPRNNKKGGQILIDDDDKFFPNPVITSTNFWRRKLVLTERIFPVCLFLIVTLLPLCDCASGGITLPDLSKIPTPPSFIHEPNPLVIYFDVESSGGSGPVITANGSASQNGGNLKERKFNCRATGFPVVNYRWLKNGQEFNRSDEQYSQRITRIPGEGSFLFGGLTNADEGTYQCIAENGNGTAYDRPIEFKRTLINLFTATRTDTFHVNYGDPFSKQCQPPHSVPTPITYWILMSGPNAPTTSFKTINFTNVAVNDQGTIFFQYVTEDDVHSGFFFTCIAENVALKDYKFGNQFHFDIVRSSARSKLGPSIAPIEQYTSPQRLTVVKNRSLELFCIFSGYPDFIPTWSKRNGELDKTRISYGTNFQKSIKIDRVTEEDAGVYECQIEKSSHLKKSFTVTVESAPFWRDGKKPRNLNSSEHSEVEFRCDVGGNPKPTVKFFKNGEPIISDERIVVDNDHLIIKNLRKSDGDVVGDNGVYHCKAENKHGYVWANFYLNILAFAPVVVEDAGEVEKVVGQNATLRCKVFGSPKPTVEWTSSNPRMLGVDGVHYDTIDVDYDGYTELRLKDLKKEDEGRYECSFKNQYNSTSSSGNLLVRAPTVIVSSPTNQTVTAGTRIELKCSAKHDEKNLKLKYFWFVHDQPVTNEDQITIDPDNLLTTLTIDSPTGSDSGAYKCVAQTKLDSAERTIYVVVKDVPLPPYSVFVVCFANTAEVSFYYTDRFNAIAPATHWVVQLNADPDEPDAWDTYVANLSNVKSGQSTFSNVTMNLGKGKANVHLYPYGDFAFRVVAINEVGHSPPAYPEEFKEDGGLGRCRTEAQPPERNPINVEVRGKTPDNLEVSWTPMPRRDWYGPNFKYLIQYRNKTSDEYRNYTVDDPYRSSAVIPDVEPFTEHDVLVWAMNEKGMPRVRPAVHSGISGESLPEAAPAGFKLKTRDGPSSATFHWVPVDPRTLNGEFKGYKVEHWYSTNKRSKSPIKEAYFDSQAREGTIYDLKPNRENFARIMVYNNAGTGPASGVILFQMPEGFPTAVQDLSAFPVSHSEIGVMWKPPREMNGNLTGYEVSVCSKSGLSPNEECLVSTVEPNALTQKRIEDLKPSTKYTVKVFAMTSAGAGDPNWAETNTTEKITAYVPPAAPSIEDVQIGKEHLNVTFKPGHEKEKPSGGHFYVRYRQKGGSDSEWIRANETVGSFTIPLKPLKSGTNYEIRAVSVHNGLETNSLSQYFTTAGGSAYSSTAGWLIAIIVAIIILIIILIIVCLVVRNRGAKYAVSEKEKEQGREPMLKEEKGFGEYARPEIEEEKRSLTAESKKSESETDSMAEYGEGENGRFTEDGSFIGQYGREKAAAEKAKLNNSSTVA